MKVSIIIPVHNNIGFTKKCLRSLAQNTEKAHLEDVIIVDNNSTDETVEYLESLNWIKPIFNKKNFGFARACNQGAEKAEGDVLLFLNNDTEVQKRWLEPLLKAIESKAVAITGSKLLFPDGLVQHAGVVIANDHIPRPIYYKEGANKPYVNKQREFKAVTAACMAVKKEVFQKVGGFDEEYVNGMEDVDFCLKVFNKGYKIIYCPDSIVTHHESVSEGRHKYNIQNMDIFLAKWGQEEPDEQRYYKEDGRSWLYRRDRELVNKYYNVYYGEKPLLLQIPGYCYRFFHKLITGLVLCLRFDFKELKQRMSR